MLPRTLVRISHEFRTLRNGGSEISADEILANVATIIDRVQTKAKTYQITHVATCAFWHSLVGVDDRGRPTTRVFGWADTRSRKYSAVIKERFDETAIHNRTGAHIHSSFWPAKLLWLRKERPWVFARTSMWLSMADYVSLKITGSADSSLSMASGTGVFNIREGGWDRELLRYLGVKRAQLPMIADRPTKPGPEVRLRWPRLADALLFPPIGDGAADHVGSCGIGKTKASLMVGTSAAMRVAYEGEPPRDIPPGLWCYRIDRNRVILGGALSDGGNLYQKFRRELKVPRNAEQQMRNRGAAAHGLSVLPFFFGERSTGYREDARGAIVGNNADADATDVLQAAMEGVAYRLAELQDRLKKVTRVKTIVASGGALRNSSVWRQIIADVLGRDLAVINIQESASRGAVLLALESLGKIDNIDRFLSSEVSILRHHPSCHAVYREARKMHQAAYEQQ
jgi:gluconokinase